MLLNLVLRQVKTQNNFVGHEYCMYKQYKYWLIVFVDVVSTNIFKHKSNIVLAIGSHTWVLYALFSNVFNVMRITKRVSLDKKYAFTKYSSDSLVVSAKYIYEWLT